MSACAQCRCTLIELHCSDACVFALLSVLPPCGAVSMFEATVVPPVVGIIPTADHTAHAATAAAVSARKEKVSRLCH